MPGKRMNWISLCGGVILCLCCNQAAFAQQSMEESVRKSIERAQQFLISTQVKDGTANDGSWNSSSNGLIAVTFPNGVSGLSMLALLSSGLTPEHDAVARGLEFLRRTRPQDGRGATYEDSVMLMVFALAKDGQRDLERMEKLVRRLESYQLTTPPFTGGWGYGTTSQAADISNSQYAILGLREAQFAGIQVSRDVWLKARDYWRRQQTTEGSWNYAPGDMRQRGSMTVAGLASLVIIDSILRETPDENRDGSPNCCGTPEPHPHLDLAVRWMERHFSATSNPRNGNHWYLYYMYGLERAGRLSAKRFFGEHDWYREGIDILLRKQKPFLGSWTEDEAEASSVLATSFALLFLSKGASPVLINKLKYGVNDAPNANSDLPWNLHPYDVQNLTDFTSTLPGWPKLMSWQEVSIQDALRRGGVQELLQAPILFMNGRDAPQFSPAEVALLRDYISQGGFLLADAACDRVQFDQGFRKLVETMYPQGEYRLKRLTAEHPVFRSEYALDSEAVELWGVDVGCRTSIIYSPHDLSCLWDKWRIASPPERREELRTRIKKGMQVGVNIVAYVTGRSPPSKLQRQDLVILKKEDNLQRGQLQIAKLRHPGAWDAAPESLGNLLAALNAYGGIEASTKKITIPLTDPTLPNFPLVYMHGRNQFELSKTELEKLREHLLRGNVLFADACCGAPQFDRSFRKLMTDLFPDRKLEPIPVTHPMFSKEIGHDLRSVRRREPISNNEQSTARILQVEPSFEGIQMDGRYVVIYSKFDISCALQRQATLGCVGYLDEDAVKLAVNIVSYILRQ